MIVAELVPYDAHDALLPVEATPSQLIAIAVRKTQQAEEYVSMAIQCGIEAGEVLLTAKARVSHGEFIPLLEREWPGSVRYAQKLMDLARNASRVTHLPPGTSLRKALAAVQSHGGDDEADDNAGGAQHRPTYDHSYLIAVRWARSRGWSKSIAKHKSRRAPEPEPRCPVCDKPCERCGHP